ncbi:hypothetical protein TGPRC2_286200, partial [Toxoplasma gondii TgCatPRC2]
MRELSLLLSELVARLPPSPVSFLALCLAVVSQEGLSLFSLIRWRSADRAQFELYVHPTAAEVPPPRNSGLRATPKGSTKHKGEGLFASFAGQTASQKGFLVRYKDDLRPE